MLSIVSMLSTPNVLYESRSSNAEDDSSTRHKFLNISGDHLTLLNIFNRFLEIERKDRKSWCSRHSISYKSMTKVLQIRKQLKDRCKELRILEEEVQGEDRTVEICKALISGLFFNTARRQENRKYKMLSSGQEFQIHPSSVLSGKNAEFIVFSEIIQTNRIYSRQVTKIDPNWLTEVIPSSFRVT